MSDAAVKALHHAVTALVAEAERMIADKFTGSLATTIHFSQGGITRANISKTAAILNGAKGCQQ